MITKKELLDLGRFFIDNIRQAAILVDMQKGTKNANELVEQIDYNPEDYE